MLGPQRDRQTIRLRPRVIEGLEAGASLEPHGANPAAPASVLPNSNMRLAGTVALATEEKYLGIEV